MKKTITLFLSVFMAFAALCGCAKAEKASKITLSSFENYYDVQKIAWNGFTGDVDLVTDKAYVTEGERSAKVTFAYETESAPQAGAQIAKENTPYLAFRSQVYMNEIGNTDNFSGLHIDIYNDTDRQIEAIFYIQLEDKSYVASQGEALASKSWNRLDFKNFPQFYALGQVIREIRIAFVDFEKYTAKDMVLYLDNCYVTKGGDGQDIKEANEGQILSFRSENDLNGILNYSQAVPAMFYSEYSDKVLAEGDSGSLRLALRSSITSIYELTSQNQGYYLRLHSSVVERSKDASKLTVYAFNAGAGDVYAQLAVTAGGKTVGERTLVQAGKTVALTADLTATDGAEITDISVKIDNWNIINDGVLYISSIWKA